MSESHMTGTYAISETKRSVLTLMGTWSSMYDTQICPKSLELAVQRLQVCRPSSKFWKPLFSKILVYCYLNMFRVQVIKCSVHVYLYINIFFIFAGCKFSTFLCGQWVKLRGFPVDKCVDFFSFFSFIVSLCRYCISVTLCSLSFVLKELTNTFTRISVWCNRVKKINKQTHFNTL